MVERPPTVERRPPRYLVLDATLQCGGVASDGIFGELSERHKIRLEELELESLGEPIDDPIAFDGDGLVCTVGQGWAGRSHLRLARRALRSGKKILFYWPAEGAVEVIDRDSYRSQRNIWLAAKVYFSILQPLARRWQGLRSRLRRLKLLLLEPRRTARALLSAAKSSFFEPAGAPAPAAVAPAPEGEPAAAALEEVVELIARAAPVEMPAPPRSESGDRIDGTGVYLRTDYWARISSGGSYGHTCYVAKELAATCRDFVAFMAYPYSLLDEFGIRQVALTPPSELSDEEVISAAARHYLMLLRSAIAALQPKFIYERLCLGNYAGAALSQEFGIPYIVEYNGSEISMRRSFGSNRYKYEELYLKAEEAAFAQATMISVVSEPIREDLVARGVDPTKILVNPNGADCDHYAPPDDDQRASLRQELGFGANHKVIGFTGTFGGWHGIDLLAEALPRICDTDPDARFLLIGDGNFKHLVDKQVARHRLGSMVVSTGRIEQKEGARLMRACDLFVSPHNRHMVDSRFFGSPTKIFEYMAVGAGIVASDLEQIGVVLSPALRPADLNGTEVEVTDQRAVLCVPGDLEEFVAGVVGLLRQRELREALGRNARQAMLDHYSWRRHVDRLWSFLRGEVSPLEAPAAPAMAERRFHRALTGDEYKDEAQDQWDSDPCGSHYVDGPREHTLDWYRDVERYRFDDYAPWMPELMEFDRHRAERVLEIGGGLGTDLSRFARGGARVVDVDLSRGHLQHAKENFALRDLDGDFVHGDAESLPFADGSFDVVYSNGVIHHTPGTRKVIAEVERVLRSKGTAIIMVYAENSLHYWYQLVVRIGLQQGELRERSIGEIMSRNVELSEAGAKPLVKVYSKARLERLFADFERVRVYKRQLIAAELPRFLRWLPIGLVGKLVGWNLVVKARRA